MKRWLVVFVLGLTCTLAAQSKMDLDTYGRIVRVADPQIAPDGRSVIVTVSRANLEENRYDVELVQVDVASGQPRVLLPARRGLTQPRWSPSGDRIAFLAMGPVTPGREAKPQVFVVPATGGEPRKLTDALSGVQHFAWSPDGRTIAFATADEPWPQSGIERHNKSFEIGNDDYLIQAAARSTHMWRVSSEGSGLANRLTSGAWSLPTSFPPGPPASPFSWSADGKSIAFTRVETPHSGDFDTARVHVLDVSTGRIRAWRRDQ
jgi:Tol biopolymer transport system component